MNLDHTLPAGVQLPQTKVNLLQCIISEQNVQQDQYHRGLVTNFNSRIANTLSDISERNRNVATTSINTLRDVSYDLLRPESSTDKLVNIDGGWGSKRASVNLAFHTTTSLSKKIEILCCYTDIWDITFGQSINPDTKIFVNKVFVMSEDEAGYGGAGTASTINAPIFGMGNTFGTRPSDLFMLDIANDICCDSPSDSLGVNSINGLESKNSNARASSFVTDYINSVEKAHSMNSGFGGISTLIGDAHSLTSTSDSVSSTSEVMQFLDERAGYNDCGYFTIGELMDFFPDQVGSSKYIVNVNDQPSSRSLDCAPKNVTGIEPVINDILSKVIPSLMTEFQIGSISLVMYDNFGKPEISIIPNSVSAMFKGIMSLSEQKLEGFRLNLLSEVMSIKMANNIQKLEFTVTCALTSSCDIDLTINDGIRHPYSEPTYAGGLLANDVTDDFNNLAALSRDFKDIITATSDIIS